MTTTASKLKNDTPGKCFSGVLRRLLCAGSLQTYPSDNYLSELHKTDFIQPKNALNPETRHSATPGPGVVARLMGLDSLPDTNWVPKQTTALDSIVRSRSVSSLDFLPQFDHTQQSLHGRFRTSVSLRESPTYLNQKNHDSFVVCFDKVDAITENGEMGMREVKEKAESRKNEKNIRGRNFVKTMENQEFSKKSCRIKERSKRVENVVMIQKDYHCYIKPNVNQKGKSPLKPMNHTEVRDQLKNRKQRKKTGVHCKRANSIASTSGEELTTRKKSPAKVEKLKKTSPKFGHKCKEDSQELRGIHKKVDRPLITGLENDYCWKMLECIFRLTEEETKESNWSFVSSKFEDFEETCIRFGDEIFQLLLEQIVRELVCEELQSRCIV